MEFSYSFGRDLKSVSIKYCLWQLSNVVGLIDTRQQENARWVHKDASLSLHFGALWGGCFFFQLLFKSSNHSTKIQWRISLTTASSLSQVSIARSAFLPIKIKFYWASRERGNFPLIVKTFFLFSFFLKEGEERIKARVPNLKRGKKKKFKSHPSLRSKYII